MFSEVLDTIAAIGTAPGDAGIAIVRVSGPGALSIADAVFSCRGRPPSDRPGGTFVYGNVCRPTDRREACGHGHIDEVVLLIYRAPHSYTRDDVIELQCHGGCISAARILKAVLRAGARLAQPGEFTRRAFLSGRIDLLQAEAVADLIRARSDRAAAAAVEQLKGHLSHSLTALYYALISIVADIEACLDFEDGELPAPVLSDIGERLGAAHEDTTAILNTWEEGHLLREGALVVISGQPNVGKSTLMNRLLGSERAIVSDLPGTTRDLIEEQLVLDGIPIRLVDTAGLREVECEIEREGVRRAYDRIRGADVVIHVVDTSRRIDPDEAQRLSMLQPERSLVVLNKTDLPTQLEADFLPAGIPVVACALVRGTGIPQLRRALTERIHSPQVGTGPAHAVISERHRAILLNVSDTITEAGDLLRSGNEEHLVLAATILRRGVEALGAATGRVYTEDLLDSIFSRFCIGK